MATLASSLAAQVSLWDSHCISTCNKSALWIFPVSSHRILKRSVLKDWDFRTLGNFYHFFKDILMGKWMGGGSWNGWWVRLPWLLVTHWCFCFCVFCLFLAALGFSCCKWAFSSCGEVCSSLLCTGFSLHWRLLLQSMGSRVCRLQWLWHTAQELHHTGLVALRHVESS